MKTKKYFMMSVLALLAYGCQNEEDINNTVIPTPGEDVKFGASLGKSGRTIYGEKADGAYPIYWVDGDQVLVSSPQCGQNGGVGSATYKVSVTNANQNFADALNKTGEIGVRWGDNRTGDFYSLYPASTNAWFNPQALHRARITLTTQQNCDWVKNTSDNSHTVQPDMSACFMYARTTGVANGAEVNLKYKPLSTAVRFKLRGPMDQSAEPVTVSYVRLYAPTGVSLSGTFDVDFSGDNEMPTVIPYTGRTYNYVSMNAANPTTGTYLTLGPNESVELNLFFLLENSMDMTEEWYIDVATAEGNVYRKYLTTLSGVQKNMTLVPGQIHVLPDLPALSSGAGWDPANWMVNIQRNVYLSEISIPGAWYSMHSSYQPDASASSYADKISNLYSNGVRAFHLDTRWRGTTKWVIGDTYLDEVQDLGVIDTDNHSFNEYGVTGGDKYLTMGAPSFEECLDAITTHVSSDEYMVVICTFAQGSGNYKGDDGGWREAIRDACKKNSKVIDACDLSPNTTVGDVLGKVIVIVNTYTPSAVTGKPLYVNLPMELSAEDTDITVDGGTSHKQGFTTNAYFSQPLKYMNSTETGITMYATYAQATTGSESGTGSTDSDRGYMPTFAERKQKAQNILTWSQQNYGDRENYSHNSWIYLGLGGYIPGRGGIWGTSDNYSKVAESLNAWINGKVEEMETNQAYYPVGIVLMNEAINYANVVRNILEMNNKYRKAYDPDRSPVDGSYVTGGSSDGMQSAAPGYSSGMTDSQKDAIGWSRLR